MGGFKYYGQGLPALKAGELKGKLVVVEGTDGVGRSTHIGLLKQWLESKGHAVLDTGMTRSALAGKGLKAAKKGNTLGWITTSLFYATDFADRLENEMIPALRAGFVVLTDRYIYSLMARATIRGADPQWMKGVYEFALKPDMIVYLRANVDDLVRRVAHTAGFNYWESGWICTSVKTCTTASSSTKAGCWPCSTIWPMSMGFTSWKLQPISKTSLCRSNACWSPC